MTNEYYRYCDQSINVKYEMTVYKSISQGPLQRKAAALFLYYDRPR